MTKNHQSLILYPNQKHPGYKKVAAKNYKSASGVLLLIEFEIRFK